MLNKRNLMASACVFALAACETVGTQAPAPPQTQRIFIAGDSTAADYADERAPQIGWGQTLQFFVADPERIENRAVNGRSTVSYVNEGRWQSLLSDLQSGDLVLISFGHNDSRDDAVERYAAPDTTYRNHLISFARDVQERHAHPVILSPAARRLWEGPAMVETHGLYRQNAGRAALFAEADFIDLSQLSLTYFETIGPAETKRDFLWLDRNPEHSRFPEGVEDNTHFTELGACGLSLLIARELNVNPVLSHLFRPERITFDRSTASPRPDIVEICAETVSAGRAD